MTDLILHHYDLSPYSEKVRLAFGLKGLDWTSVEQPLFPPKPDLLPLTGGYRRAPVLQVGADVYCDTSLIIGEIERRHPEPTLYPGGQVGLCRALAWWWERTTFIPAASVATAIIGEHIPEGMIADRKEIMSHDFSKEASLRDLPLNRQLLAAHMAWLADMLKDGRPYLLGDAVSAADLGAYQTIWFARKNGGAEAEALLPVARFDGWMARVAALGHGRRREMPTAEALRIAREAEPEPVRIAPDGDPSGLRPGQPVVVRADDTGRDPVRGTLVAADAEELVLRREDDRAGVVHVHFPRAGFAAVAA